MTNTEITEAIIRLRPTAQFMLAGDNFTDIEWLCECTKPTIKEIEAEVARLPQIIAEKEAAKQAILDRLGITNEEAKLILS